MRHARKRDRHVAVSLPPQLVEFLLRALKLGSNCIGASQKNVSHRRQLNAFRSTLKQDDAELALELELVNAARDAWLRGSQVPSSGTQASSLCDCQKVIHGRKLDRHG